MSANLPGRDFSSSPMPSSLRLFMLLFLPLIASAQSGTWSGSILGGNATWNTSANWTGGTVANGIDAVATFNGDFSANLQLTVSSPVTVGDIRWTDTSTTNPDRGLWLMGGNVTFAKSSGTPSITITADSSGGNHDIPLRFFGATILGSQGLVLNLEGANYNGLSAGARLSAGSNWSGFSGPLTLQAGRFRVEATNNTLPPNSEIIVNPGVWFQIVRGYASGLGSQSIRGLSGGDSTTLVGCENNADSATAAGTLTLGATAAAGDAYAFSGTLGGDMFGTGTPNTNFSIAKSGPGIQRLNGSSLYTGATTVSGGTLLVNGNHTQGSGAANAGRYLVAAGGRLGGIGSIVLSDVNAGATGLSISGVLAPGDPAVNGGIGNLTIDAAGSARPALSFETGGSLFVALGPANTSDRVALVGGAAGDIVFNNTIVNFGDTASGALPPGPYVLFTSDAANAYSGLVTNSSGIITAGLSIGSGLAAYQGSNLQRVGNDIVLNLGLPVSNRNLTVTSIEALKSVSTLTDATITLAPGTYWLTGPATRPSPSPDYPIFLDLAGDNTTYVFTGVTIRVDTRELRGYGRVYAHSDTVRVLQVSGANAVVDGLTLRMEHVAMNGVDAWGAPRQFTADWGTNLVELVGSGVTVKNCTFTTGGSFPYGYGDAFGKGTRPQDANGVTNAAWIDHRKQSGIRIGKAASGVTLDNITLNMRSYGHGIFMQDGASDIVIKNSYILGDTLADSDTIIAHPIYQQWGFATYYEKIPADIRLSRHEDAIRVYINTAFATNGWPQYVNNLTVQNTRIERMRDAVAAGDMTGFVRVSNVESYGCEQGFTPSNIATENTFTACKGDAVNGPLVFFRRSANNATFSVELAGSESPIGTWPVALIAGNNNAVTLTRTAPAGLYPTNAYINVAQSWREWRHDPAVDIDAAVANSEVAASSGNTITNQTGLPLVFGRNATNNTAVSDGGVINKGSGNTYVGATLVSAPVLVTDTWGTYEFYSGVQSATNATSLGGANADAGTVVSAGGTLQIAAGLAIQGEPLSLAGTLASAGATANTTRFNSTGTAPITLAGDAVVSVTTAANQFLVGPVSGAGNLSKTGPGTLVMEGNANTFSGSLTVSAGAVTARANKAVGDLVVAAGATFNGAASLSVNQPAGASATIHGTLVVNSRGAADTDAHVIQIGRLAGSGRITTTNSVLGTVSIAGDGDFAGGIDGALGLVKTGSNTTLRLSGNPTYTGATTISAGALDMAGSLPAGTALSIASGATLTRSVSRGALQVATFSGASGSVLRPTGLPADFDPRRVYSWPLLSAVSITGSVPNLAGDALPATTGSFALGASSSSINLTHTPTPYAAWQLARGIPAASPASADFDGNGRADLLDYALSSGTASGWADPAVSAAAGGATLAFAFLRGRADLVYAVESSPDLQTWSVIATNPGSVGQSVTVSVPVSTARHFLRLRVTR